MIFKYVMMLNFYKNLILEHSRFYNFIKNKIFEN